MTDSGKFFYRAIQIRSRGNEMRGAIEDDYHHFRVHLRHDGKSVTGIASQAFRFPWTLCPGATGALRALEGSPLFSHMANLGRLHDARTHCTHLFDLASLMIALARRGIPERRYFATLPYRKGGKTTARLSRDGKDVLHWRVDGSVVRGAPPFAETNIGTGFTSLVSRLDPDDAEDALVLRRAVFISSGRGTELDEIIVAPSHGGCFVQRPERAGMAVRKLELRRDFTSDPSLLTATDTGWLSFLE